VDGIAIREARVEDCADILELWQLTVSGSPVMDTAQHLRTIIEQNGDMLLVAEFQGRIVGTVLGGWDLWRGHIYRLAVHPDQRRQGIARALMCEIQERLRNRGARRVYALTETADGRRFWQSTDFEETSDTTFVRNI
jgi:ribosomal protein S18 acetylase RimI-like enzyme